MSTATKITFLFEVERLSAKKWKATANCGSTSHTYTASSKSVAIGKAAQVLTEIIEVPATTEPKSKETPPVESARFEVVKGRKRGLLVTVLRKLQGGDGEELWEVKYSDGSAGFEKPRFLVRALEGSTYWKSN